MTWMEIVDTTIKISLGAIVAGIFGYLNVKHSQSRDERARYAKRRRDHLEKILEMLIEVEQTYIGQKDAIERYRFYKEREIQKAKLASSDFLDFNDKLYIVMTKFTHTNSILLMK